MWLEFRPVVIWFLGTCVPLILQEGREAVSF
jgi:hypothetical protein